MKFRCLILNAMIFFSGFFLMSCAGVAPPPGGPIDTTPPEIISTFPFNNSTRVSTNKIRLEFSKYVDQMSVEQSIFISPYVGILENSWSGREIEITFPDTVKKNTTYVVTVGTDVVDLHNRNRMAQAFSLAFATGDSIDHGIISGKVIDQKSEGVMVYAYKLDNINPDTLNPTHTKPDFLTQAGKGGNFVFHNVPDNSYRVIAVRDELKNLLYDPGMDAYGVPFKNIRVSNDVRIFNNVIMKLSKEDTTTTQFIMAKSRDDRHLILRFSKAIDITSLKYDSIVVCDSVGSRVKIYDWFVDGKSTSTIVLATDTLSMNKKYVLSLPIIFDEEQKAVRVMDSLRSFSGPVTRDTMKLHVNMSPADSTRDVMYDQTVGFQFNDPVQRPLFEKGFTLVDSNHNIVPGSFRWHDGISVEYQPTKPLREGEWYSAELLRDYVKDFKGNQMKDSVMRRRFRTIESEKLSSISGEVIDSIGGEGRFVVEATEPGEAAQKVYSTITDSTKKYSIDNIPAGLYVLSAFRNKSGKKKYDYGKPFPFCFSAPFGYYPDTLKVRARWPIEGVKLKVK